jgi:hypothetical protein
MAEELYATIAIGVLIALLAMVWTSVHLGASYRPPGRTTEEPGRLILDLVRKKTPWPMAATFVLAGELVTAGVLALAVSMVISHYRSRREVVDVLARRLPRNPRPCAATPTTPCPGRRRGGSRARPRT